MIQYVVAAHFGSRRSPRYSGWLEEDPLILVRTHLAFLKACRPKISEAVLVANGMWPSTLPDLVGDRMRIVHRPDWGFSYAAWNEVVKEDAHRFDHHFLVEDDYVPLKADFYEPFLARCTDENPFVCSLVAEANAKRHPGVSNGLLQSKAAQHVLEEYPDVFPIAIQGRGESAYQAAFRTQVGFLDNLTALGYTFSDVMDEYTVDFHDSKFDITGTYGDPGHKESLLVPAGRLGLKNG